MKSSQANNKVVGSKLDVLEQQTKQFIGERQGAWELHYSNQEIGLRKKADKNKELLQLHQTEAQVMMMGTMNKLKGRSLLCLEKGRWAKEAILGQYIEDRDGGRFKVCAGSALAGEDGHQLVGDDAGKPASGRLSDNRGTAG